MEIWRDIEGYEGLYRISNKGRVYSKITNIIMKPKIEKDGHYRIGLRKDGKRKFYRINRLVAIAFIPKEEGKEVVNHKDGNKINNNVENLEWCTISYNVKHAYDNNLGNFKIKALNNLSKALKKSNEVKRQPILAYKNGELIGEYKSQIDCAKALNIPKENISGFLRGKVQKNRKGYAFVRKGVMPCQVQILE